LSVCVEPGQECWIFRSGIAGVKEKAPLKALAPKLFLRYNKSHAGEAMMFPAVERTTVILQIPRSDRVRHGNA
jgi:hypothetical protein